MSGRTISHYLGLEKLDEGAVLQASHAQRD
jgi:hypothetical protein